MIFYFFLLEATLLFIRCDCYHSWNQGVNNRLQTTKLRNTQQKFNNKHFPVPKIIIAGAPASGKGTQCEIIKKEFGVIHLSTGDILRAAIKDGTELGMKAKSFMDGGKLVPDELIIDVVKNRLSQEDCMINGWLLDGFPRTKPQADALSAANFIPDCFILLDVPEDVLVERVTGRRTDPVTGKIYHMKFSPPENDDIASRLIQRSDDTAEKVVVRYRDFKSNIDAIQSSYEDKLVWIDGTQPAKDVSKFVISGVYSSLACRKSTDEGTANSPVDKCLKVIIAGAPASGKGTQCEVIKSEFGLVHLSTGDILRAAIKDGSELGMKAKSFMDAGKLVPDELIIDVVKERLSQEDCQYKGWLLDGFPRTKPQADALSAASFIPDCFILLDVPEDVLVERVTGRRTDPVTGKIYHMKFSPPENDDIASRLIQRSDDTAEKVVVRYRDFKSNIDAIQSSYEDKLIWIDGTQPAKNVSGVITKQLQKIVDRKNRSNHSKNDTTTSTADSDVTITKYKKAGGGGKIQVLAGLSSLILSDKLLARVFAKAGWLFPSALAGMVGVFVCLQGLHTVSPEAADYLAASLSPAVSVLKAWLPFFFVPPLVVLPLKLRLISDAAAPLAVVLVGGLLASLTFSALLAKALDKSPTPPSANTKEVASAVAVTAAAPAAVQYPSALGPAVVAVASLLLTAGGALSNTLASLIFAMSSTIFGYLAGVQAPPVIKRVMSHPVISCTAITIGLLNIFAKLNSVPIATLLGAYFGTGLSGAGDIISSLLGPAVISFGIQLYQYRDMLSRNALRMTLVTITSALFGLFSSAGVVGLLSISPIQTALAPLTRCITTPLALAGCNLLGGDPSVAAFLVVVTGILGASFGERFLRAIGVEDPVSVGLSLGASAHGLGAASVSCDPVKFAAALVSMTLTGLWTVTSLSIPPIRRTLIRVATRF